MISGIPGSAQDHFGVPYSLTEEFSIVYRMHPLIADTYTFRSAADDQLIAEYSFPDIAGPHAQEVAERIDLGDAIYSFGVAHPGALVLNNYPRFLQQFQRPDNDRLMDLAATDILRSRELGVPRYNQFRRLLHLKPARSFEELTDDPAQLEALRRLHRDVDSVDTIVGMFAEKRPEGFGFSDTAFRIFILMASRRLNSDRYFTNDFTPEIYTSIGMDWVEQTSMIDVVLRHYPQLRPVLRGVTNCVPAVEAGGRHRGFAVEFPQRGEPRQRRLRQHGRARPAAASARKRTCTMRWRTTWTRGTGRRPPR